MLDTHLKSPVTRHRLRSGPATQHVDAFAEWLHRQGYRPVTIDTTLRSLAGWTDWMRGAGLSMHDVLAPVCSRHAGNRKIEATAIRQHRGIAASTAPGLPSAYAIGMCMIM